MKNKKAFFRFRAQKEGGHHHVTMFTSPDPEYGYANCGSVIFDEDEWVEVRAKLQRIGEVFEREEDK